MMVDLFYVGIVLLFFLVSIGLVLGTQRLMED